MIIIRERGQMVYRRGHRCLAEIIDLDSKINLCLAMGCDENEKGASLYETHPVGPAGLEPATNRL